MKFNKNKTFFSIITLLIILILPSCKDPIDIQLFEIWGVGIKVVGEERSNFSAYVNLLNNSPQLEGTIKDWSFKIYSGDTLLFEINNENYNNLGFQTQVRIPAPNYYYGGNMMIMMGIPYYESKTVFVDTDIFLGKRPDKFDFFCTIKDIRGDITDISSPGNTLTYLEYDPDQD